ncbi:hypothetical protein GGTG_05526 [Gaeumannomyces tritici R3-111a-1]|uniref:Uncharacterized protein n=1 Tax=Gaeumannomyces tritici (strain R3-111a-1) TaxID=644352 RepID=J3NW61_GAET3|nr:hypothetical protein GGTG_05526 [Gaeumannomyces tritici R3-111a-1]EJT75593.1 hypothetical protein GGTG_05526 [Gaeumannomyces tritici R3-111a-1]
MDSRNYMSPRRLLRACWRSEESGLKDHITHAQLREQRPRVRNSGTLHDTERAIATTDPEARLCRLEIIMSRIDRISKDLRGCFTCTNGKQILGSQAMSRRSKNLIEEGGYRREYSYEEWCL